MFNPSEIPAWVSGGASNDGSARKYHRAVKFLQGRNAELKAQGKPEEEITEAALKELYVKWGGLVLQDVAEEPQDEAPRRTFRKRAE